MSVDTTRRRLSRRDFLKGILPVAGALVAAPFLSPAEEALAAPTTTLPTPVDVLRWINNPTEQRQDIKLPEVRLGLGGSAALGLIALPIAIRTLGLKNGLKAAATVAMGGALAGCGPGGTPEKSATPLPKPTEAQIAEVTQQVTAVAAATPQVEVTATAVEPVHSPTELAPSNPPVPSVIKGLFMGQIAPGETAGTVPGYLTPINTLYRTETPTVASAFGIDQEFLKQYFKAKTDDKGVTTGTTADGVVVILKNGIWTAPTGETFIPFTQAKPGSAAVFPVIDANGMIQEVDVAGKPVGAARAMFETPQTIAQRMNYPDASGVKAVEATQSGALAYVSDKQLPPENKMIQVVNETDFLLPAEELAKNEVAIKVVESFANALTAAGLPKTNAELLSQGFTVMRVEGLDPTDKTKTKKMSFDVATIRIEDGAIGGNYPIIIKNEKGEWKKASMGNMGKLIGKNIGTNLSSPSKKNDFGATVATSLDKLVTAEYNLGILDALGFTWTEWEQNKYDWTRSDSSVALARANGMKIEGDDLVYGSSNQKNTYLKGEFTYKGEKVNLWNLKNTDPDKAKTILTDIMVNHVTQMVKKYKGRVDQWSVVNEIGNAPGKDIYMDIIGPSYVRLAFQAARAADPGALLLLNEDKSDTMNGEKYSMIKAIVDDLKKDNLIDAIGLQMHIDGANPPAKETLIEGFKSWGIQVIVSSLDINMRSVGGSQAERIRKQSELGVSVYRALEESGVGADYNLWEGFGDKYNWLENPNIGNQPKADPTPFLDAGEPKLWAFAIEKEILDTLQ